MVFRLISLLMSTSAKPSAIVLTGYLHRRCVQWRSCQSIELPMPGMPVMIPMPHYTYDLEKAAAEFKLADLDKDVSLLAMKQMAPMFGTWASACKMLYNTGNTTRQIIAEIMANSLASVNDKFSSKSWSAWPTT
jgi:hypothetical protein